MKVIFDDPDKVNIYGFCDVGTDADSSAPILLEVCNKHLTFRRVDELSEQLGKNWYVVAYHKLTSCKITGNLQARRKRKLK